MMFQPQFYGLKSVVTILHSCKPCLQSSEAEGELLQVDLLCNIERNLAFTSIYGIIPRRGL